MTGVLFGQASVGVTRTTIMRTSDTHSTSSEWSARMHATCLEVRNFLVKTTHDCSRFDPVTPTHHKYRPTFIRRIVSQYLMEITTVLSCSRRLTSPSATTQRCSTLHHSTWQYFSPRARQQTPSSLPPSSLLQTRTALDNLKASFSTTPATSPTVTVSCSLATHCRISRFLMTGAKGLA